jgi:hypothetical protein
MAVEIRDKIIDAAIDFDTARLEAARLQRERNDSEECGAPEALYRAGTLEQYNAPCWKAKWGYGEDGERTFKSRGWCDYCKERQRLHEAMSDARAHRGAALRRLSYWRQKLGASDD